ncbi:MAG: hypothetical protein AB9921_00510 [Erysipelotrichaceae bacterium]
MKSSITLTIYDETDEILAEFAESRIRWGIIEDVVDLSEKLAGESEREAIQAMGTFIQLVFPKLTKELLRQADVNDIKRCFQQIVSVVKNIEGTTEKNVETVKTP